VSKFIGFIIGAIEIGVGMLTGNVALSLLPASSRSLLRPSPT
jgi:hypothetical protein